MFQETFTNFPQRKTTVCKTTNPKSIIRIEKSKLLPSNFFKPLTIQLEPLSTTDHVEQPLPTPCFGSHQEEKNQFQCNKPSQFTQKIEKQQFHSWFSRGMKPLSSRVQTVPVDMGSSLEKKRHVSQRKTCLQRVRSVQDQSNKSAFKVYKKYEPLIADKVQKVQKKSDNHYKYKINPTNLESVEKSFKSHFKVSGMKRGYAETKYKQNKALSSINSDKQGTLILPLISNG